MRSMNSSVTPDKIMQVGLGFWASKTLLSAIEMELFTELAKHPEDLRTLQGRMGLHPRSARDFLDAARGARFSEARRREIPQHAGDGFVFGQEQVDYTGADCMGWMKEAGFRETRVEHLVGPDSMVIGIK